MVCNRCIKVVKDELTQLNVQIEAIGLGWVSLVEDVQPPTREKIKTVLHANGFELIDDKKSRLIESIKTLLIQSVHQQQHETQALNTSAYLSQKLGYDYSYLSHLFSSVEGLTIEKYIIHQKVERAKELLVYDELTLSEIADQLGYSSVQHLSSQFKKVSGLTPSHFKKLKHPKRTPLDEV